MRTHESGSSRSHLWIHDLRRLIRAFFLSVFFSVATLDCSSLRALVPDDLTSKIQAIEAAHRRIDNILENSDWVFTMRLNLSHDELVPWRGKQLAMGALDTTIMKKLGKRLLRANGISGSATDQNGQRLEIKEQSFQAVTFRQ